MLPWWDSVESALELSPRSNKHLRHPCPPPGGAVMVSLLSTDRGGEGEGGSPAAATLTRQVNPLLKRAHHMVDKDVAMIRGQEVRR